MNKAAFCKRVRELAEAFPGGATISGPVRIGVENEPAFPPARCPFEVVVFVEIGPGEEEGELVARPVIVACTGEPRPNGWCNAHQGSQVLLDLGHALGYPYVPLCDERAVAGGRENWEGGLRETRSRALAPDGYSEASDTFRAGDTHQYEPIGCEALRERDRSLALSREMSTTADIYSHVLPPMHESAMEKMDSFLDSSSR